MRASLAVCVFSTHIPHPTPLQSKTHTSMKAFTVLVVTASALAEPCVPDGCGGNRVCCSVPQYGKCYDPTREICCVGAYGTPQTCDKKVQHCGYNDDEGKCGMDVSGTCTAGGGCSAGDACCIVPGSPSGVAPYRQCFTPAHESCCVYQFDAGHQGIQLCSPLQSCDTQCGCMNPDEQCCVSITYGFGLKYYPSQETCCGGFICEGAGMKCCHDPELSSYYCCPPDTEHCNEDCQEVSATRRVSDPNTVLRKQ